MSLVIDTAKAEGFSAKRVASRPDKKRNLFYFRASHYYRCK